MKHAEVKMDMFQQMALESNRELYRVPKHVSRRAVAKAKEMQRVKFANELNSEEGKRNSE